MVKSVKSDSFISRDTINKKLFKDFIVEDARNFQNKGNSLERSLAKKKFLKDFVILFKKTYNRSPAIIEIENITRSGNKIIKKHLVQGKDFLTSDQSRNLTQADPELSKSKLQTRINKPVKELSFMALGTKEGKKTIVPRFVNKSQENEYKKLLKEKYSVPKGRSFISNEDITKKFLNTKNPTKNQIDKIKLINAAIKKELNLEYPKQTYEGEALLKQQQRARRAKAIKDVSSPSKEAKIRDLKKGSPLDLAHRSSLTQNRNLGLKYLVSDLGFDPSKINQEIIIPTEQKLESLYKKQKFLVNKAQKFHLDKNKKIPLTLQKALEDINKQITDAAYRTEGRLNGIVVDEKTLKPGKVGIDYSKVPGMGLIENKAVKDLTKADMDLIKLNAGSQIQNETKNLINLYEGAPQKIKNALETRIGCKSGCFVKTLNENPQKVTQQLKAIFATPEVTNIKAPLVNSLSGQIRPELPSVKYNNITGLMVNTANGDKATAADMKKFEVENPLKTVAGTEDAYKPIAKGMLKTVGAALTKVGAPLPTALLDGYFISKQVQEDRPAAEIAADPLNWLGLALMSPATKAATRLGGGVALRGILTLGLAAPAIAATSTIAGIALAGTTAYQAYKEYDRFQNEKGLIYNYFNPEAKAV